MEFKDYYMAREIKTSKRLLFDSIIGLKKFLGKNKGWNRKQ